MSSKTETARRRLLTILVFIVAAVIAGGTGLATVYTDLLWFEELGQTGVFWTALGSAWGTGAAFALATFALLYANVLIARRFAPRVVLRPVVDTPGPPQLDEVLRRFREQIEPHVRIVLLAGSVLLAISVGASMANLWPTFRLALAAQTFGVTDPQFGRDVGFYVFSLPALRSAVDWLFGALIMTTIATAAVHLIDGAIDLQARVNRFSPHVKAHLSVLGGLALASKAFDYWLQIYELNFSARGQVLGASYTDVHAQLPALRILIVIALVSAATLLVNIRQRGWRLPIIALGIWVGAALIVGQVYPALIQQFRVSPNEIAAEAPYIERNIAATRAAFDLEDVEVQPFPASDTLTARDVADNVATISNVRLWDPNVVQRSYEQLQEIRLYYSFTDVDIDRYTVDGEYRQTLVSAREMNVDELDERARTWINQHLVYTHGYGVVVSPVNLADTKGYPRFILRDIPPVTDTDLTIEQPRIYYGEETYNYVVAPTAQPEFDYPIGDAPAENTYDGAGGVSVESPLRRVAFALRFSTARLLLAESVTAETKVLFRRTITERVEALAPWLAVDRDPYMAIVDGRAVWILDGYTISDHYPYSQSVGNDGVNYIRNSVKVTIDAYDGTTTFYAFDTEDPVLAAWREVFPELLTDVSEMPEEVRAHLRYPEDLFTLQAEVYKTYHMLDPEVFYNKEDQWELPGERSGEGAMLPYYVLMRLPGESHEEFILMQPFTPRNKDNMVGWMAARCDGEDYGRRLVYQFPKGELIFGPEQVAASINQDPVISQQLSLWNQRGSQVIFGNMLVMPIEDSVVFIQPLYLQADETPIPELTRVIVAFADRVSMEEDLATALEKVFGVDVPDEIEGGAPTDPGGEEPTPPTADAARAAELYTAAIEAQRAGDWSEYGRLMDELGDVLAGLAEAAQEATAAP